MTAWIRGRKRPIAVAGLLTLILLAAAVVRLVDLANQPGGLYPDEAAEGLSALQLLHAPQYQWSLPVFFDNDGGREALFAYVVAAAFRIFGETVVVLRAVSAVLGVLAVFAMFVAVRRFGRGAALTAAAWAAGSLWLISVSRDGMRNMLCVAIGALALAALLRWHDRPNTRTALLAGGFVGLALWTYQPLKLLPILVVIWLWMAHRHAADRIAAMLRQWRWAAAAFVVVAAPMLWTAVTDAHNYFGRGADVTAFSPDQQGSNLLSHTLLTLGQFFWSGDPNQRHDVGQLPLLGVPLTALALLGAWRAWQLRRDAAHLLILLGIPTFLIPPLVAVEGGAPHFLRNLGLAPYLAALIGLGALHLLDLARRIKVARIEPRVMARLAPALAAGLLALGVPALGAASAQAYFSRPVAQRYDAYTFDLVALAQASYGDSSQVVVVSDYDSLVIRFLDAYGMPTIVAPNASLPRVRLYSSLVAATRQQLSQFGATNSDPSQLADVGDLGLRAAAIAFDPTGTPRAFIVRP